MGEFFKEIFLLVVVVRVVVEVDVVVDVDVVDAVVHGAKKKYYIMIYYKYINI